ncbi:MAG: LPS assembly protein LptD [Alphaproteobacteria bacterium]|nr:LPS assembly protein LptD [Alphaproteobacteria bacterium]
MKELKNILLTKIKVKYLIHFFTLSLFHFCANGAKALPLSTDTPVSITADTIVFDRRAQSVHTDGRTIIETDGTRMTLLDAYLTERGWTAGSRHGEILLGTRTLIEGSDIAKVGPTTTASRGLYTACHICPDSRHAWEFTASRIRHEADDQMIHLHNTVLWVYGVPVLWLPYISYPDPSVRFKSGLLMPTTNTTANMGYQINVPLYLNFSNYHDATITFGYLTDENPIWLFEHRLNAERSSFRTTGSFTRNTYGVHRWHIFNNNYVELGENARANIFINRTSDNTFLQQYSFYDAQPFLDTGARIELFGESGYIVASGHTFQELRSNRTHGNQTTQSGDIFPHVRGTFQTLPIFNDTFITFNGDIIGMYNRNENSNVQRMVAESGIVSPWTIWGGNRITLSANARYDLYYFHQAEPFMGAGQITGAKTRFLPSAFIEWSLPLINTQSPNWIHVIEPRARFTVVRVLEEPAFANIDSTGAVLSDATLFSANRIPGLDLWMDGDFLDYGLSWTAMGNNGLTISTFVGQTYIFTQDTEFNINSGFHAGASDIVARASIDYKDWFTINNRARWDSQSFAVRHFESFARLGTRHFIEAGYIMAVQLADEQFIEDSRAHEIAGGFGVHLNQHWHARARTTYNITDNRIQRQAFGIYYEHSCYMIGFEFGHDGARRLGATPAEDFRGQTTFKLVFSLRFTE